MSDGILALAARSLNHAFDPHISPAESERRLLDLETVLDEPAIAVLREAELSRRALTRLTLEARLWLLHIRLGGRIRLRATEINSLLAVAKDSVAMSVTARAIVDTMIELESETESEESPDPHRAVAEAISRMTETVTVEGGIDALWDALEMARAAQAVSTNTNEVG